jgi:hypothetical protein
LSEVTGADDPDAAAEPLPDAEDVARGLYALPPDFPRAALDAARMKPEGIVDRLIEILDSARQRMLDGRPPRNAAHLFALLLLASYEETSAFDSVVRFCSLDDEQVGEMLDDFVTEDLPRVFASLCGEQTERLVRIVESPSYAEYVRAAALRAFVALVQRRLIARETAAAYFEILMRKRLQRVPSAVWDALAIGILDLHVTDLFDDIRRRIEDGLVDEGMISEGDMVEAQNLSLETAMERLDSNSHLWPVRDVVAETEWWHCFETEFDDDPDADWDLDEDDDDDDDWQVLNVRETAKVGRNDPCPCGSGKKFKKCCLGTAT